jgi:hypothetical protein
MDMVMDRLYRPNVEGMILSPEYFSEGNEGAVVALAEYTLGLEDLLNTVAVALSTRQYHPQAVATWILTALDDAKEE